MTTFVALDIGKRRVRTKGLVDGENILAVERAGDALVLLWARDVEDLDPPEEAGEELMGLVGGELLEHHRDARGILAWGDAGRDEPFTSYAAIVARHASTGRWLANLSHEEGAVPDRDMRRAIPVRNVPSSRFVEIFVMSPARAMRDLGLGEAPRRVVCLDRSSSLAPAEVSAFYVRELAARGLRPKRRVWSDGSTEQLVLPDLLVHAERTSNGTFVRVAAIER